MSIYEPPERHVPWEIRDKLTWFSSRSDDKTVPEVIEPGPTAFSHWPVEYLDIEYKGRGLLLVYGLEKVADAVRGLPELPEGDARVEVEIALVRHSAPLPPSVSDDQAFELHRAFGSCGFGFDVLGMLCRTNRIMRGDPGAGVGPGVPRVKDARPQQRLYNGLLKMGCETMWDTVLVPDEKLTAIRRVGPDSVRKLRDYATECARACVASLPVAAEGARWAWEVLVFGHHWPLDATAYDACMPLAAVEEIGPGRTPDEYADAVVDLVGAMPQLHGAMAESLMVRVREEHMGYRDSAYPRVVPVPQGAGWDFVASRVSELPLVEYDGRARELNVHYRRLEEWLAEEELDDLERLVIDELLAGTPIRELPVLGVPGHATVSGFARHVLSRTPALVEDRYGHFFNTYRPGDQEFLDLTGEPVSTLQYLFYTSRWCMGESRPLALAFGDPDVPAEVREAVRARLADSHIELDGVLVERDRDSILRHLVERHAAERLMPLVELREHYCRVVDLAGDPDGSLALPSDDKKLRNRLNKLGGIMALPKAAERRHGGSVRLYDPDEHDLATLESFLSLFSPCGVTRCSADEVFADERLTVAMEAAGVTNGYELHYVLFRHCRPMPFARRQRTPMLDYGWPLE